MNTVVYYPHIYPPPEWLKVAALCWDKVYRLAPPDWSDDPDSIKDLNNAFEGILVDIDLKKIVDQEVQKQFEQWIDARGEKLKTGAQYTEVSGPRAGPIVSGKILHSSEASIEHKAVDDLFTTTATIYDIKLGGWSESIKRGFLELLERHNLIREKKNAIGFQIPDWEKEAHSEKPQRAPDPGSAHEKYKKLLEEAGEKRNAGDAQGAQVLYKEAERIRQQHLITVKETQHVIHLPKDVALYYLSLCASKAALEERRDLVANGEQFTDVVFHDFRTKIQGHDFRTKIQGEVATSVLQAYLPKNFLTMESKRLAEFRTEFATQRLEYEKDIQDLVKTYADVASEGQLDVLKKSVIDIAKKQIEEKKKTYTRANVEMVMKAFSISLTPPALATSIASLLGVGIFAPVGIAAALSLFATNLLLNWQKAESEKKKSPWSYVLDVEKMR